MIIRLSQFHLFHILATNSFLLMNVFAPWGEQGLLGIVDKMKHVLFIILGFPLLILSTHVANSKEEKVNSASNFFFG